jgi:hypothetical protein
MDEGDSIQQRVAGMGQWLGLTIGFVVPCPDDDQTANHAALVSDD